MNRSKNASAVFWSALILIACCLSTGRAQKVDVLNTNGMSDVWEYFYSAAALAPNADSDGDGISNSKESIAGTDPLSSSSVARLAPLLASKTNFNITIPCELGKRYELQSAQLLAGGGWSNWISEAAVIVTSGTNVTFNAPTSLSAKLFRISITDVDTDGDGVNDWEEYKVGLDPNNPMSNNQLNSFFQPMTDYEYVTSRITLQNTVTIVATDSTANQPDANQAVVNFGLFTITRGGFPLTSINVNLGLGGPGAGYANSGVDHAALPTSLSFPAGTSSQTVTLTPLANTNRLTPAVATLRLLTGTGYSLGWPSNASVTIIPSDTAMGTGLTGYYYTNASPTYANAANFNPANLKMTRVDTNVDFTWGTTSTPIANNGYYCVRWVGQVQPQYSETYYFVANTDDGVKLWVNDQLIIDSWITKSASDLTAKLDLQGGVRYNIKMEYFQNAAGSAGAHLSWYGPNQAKQVIPQSRLYPTNVATAPSALISSQTAVGFLNVPFSFTVAGANTPTRYSASPLPPGLTFNTTSGLMSGTPTVAGDYQVMLTSSNSVGIGGAVLLVQIFDTGSSLTREIWTNAPGVNVADIPLNRPADITNAIGAAEGVTDYADDYGERVTGYITIATTGNYYFWLAGNDSAELWISNDHEPVNKLRRATASGTGSRQWNLASKQKTGWLSLTKGQKYYMEILHKAGVGTNDNWSVGWLLDPSGTNNTASGLISPYTLSRHFDLPPSFVPGTLYSANMVAQAGIVSSGVGSATLRLSADGTQAILKFNFSNLSSPLTGRHVHTDPTGKIVFDIDDATPQADGSYSWNLPDGFTGPGGSSGSYTNVAQLIEAIRQGRSYINIHTTLNQNGEINGHFTATEGSPTFNPPADPPIPPDDHPSASAAARFLLQATFGPSPAEVTNVQALGYSNWIEQQISMPMSSHLQLLLDRANPDPTQPYNGNLVFNNWWRHSITAPDQLRQRVAFALSEIMVVSDQGILQDNGRALSSYYDMLATNAFGNFRELLESVTLHPAMGLYLDMRGNAKGSIVTGVHANENYAREILQLFSVGLYRQWPDASLVLDSAGDLVPTYTQEEILGFAKVFTGWNYWQPNQGNGRLPTSFSPGANYTNSMVLVPLQHDLTNKLVLDNVVLPPALGSNADSSSTNFDNYCSKDLELAHDSIFYNENVGPFICRQLIQRLVTSHPSRDYVYRVVQKFKDNGAGVRGDMAAVIKAILLDYEARSPVAAAMPAFGKQREPLLRVTALARAFPCPPSLGGTYLENNNLVLSVTTSNAHRLNNNDNVTLGFTDTSGQIPPPAQTYGVTVTSPTSFNITAPGLQTGTYTQAVSATFTNVVGGVTNIFSANAITVNVSGNGLLLSNYVYLTFTNGGALSGEYQLIWQPNNNTFAVAVNDPVARSGGCVLNKFVSGGGYTVTQGTNAAFFLVSPHGMAPGNYVWINFTDAGAPADGRYQVLTVPDPKRFTIVVNSVGNGSRNGMVLYPLIAPPIIRSGSASVQWSTFNMNVTDTGTSSSLLQTPLNAPTVFNYYFPDFHFPGTLSAAGLTTPEFQLTSDTGAMLQMNFVEGGLLNNTGNTNGLSSFTTGNGNIVVDLGAYLTPAYTSNAGIPSLIAALNSLMCGGQLSSTASNTIMTHVANTSNYAYTTPTYTQMRDRARAVVHLIASSPDFIIQK